MSDTAILLAALNASTEAIKQVASVIEKNTEMIEGNAAKNAELAKNVKKLAGYIAGAQRGIDKNIRPMIERSKIVVAKQNEELERMRGGGDA